MKNFHSVLFLCINENGNEKHENTEEPSYRVFAARIESFGSIHISTFRIFNSNIPFDNGEERHSDET